MKKIRERVIKGVIFVGIFFILFGIFSYILQPKNNDRASGMDQPTAYAILAEKENMGRTRLYYLCMWNTCSTFVSIPRFLREGA